MRGDLPARRRRPLTLILTGSVIWTAAIILAVFGWWGAAAVAAVWGTVLVAALAYRYRPNQDSTDPDLMPPPW
jgi:hypothetical protein